MELDHLSIGDTHGWVKLLSALMFEAPGRGGKMACVMNRRMKEFMNILSPSGKTPACTHCCGRLP